MEPSHDTSSELISKDNDDQLTEFDDFNETYDKSSIIYADDIPIAEEEEQECLEINDTPDDICMTFKDGPIDGLLSPIPSFRHEHLKSPITTISDCGYESHGSPISLQEYSYTDSRDDLNYLLNDLFPALA